MPPEPSQSAALSAKCGRMASRLAQDCSGATAIEYAIMTFIAIAVLVIVNQLGISVAGLYQRVLDGFNS